VSTEQTNEVETTFVGGPLHGLHQQDITKEFRVVKTDKPFLYARYKVDDDSGRVVYILINRSPQTAG